MEAASFQIQSRVGLRSRRSLLWVGGKFRPQFQRSVAASRRTGAPRLSVSMRLDGSSTGTPGFETDTALKYTEDTADDLIHEPVKSCPASEPVDVNLGMDTPVPKEGALEQKRAAKIHDFCLGVPFGGFVFGGGLVGFLISRNPTNLTFGVLLGCGLLALSFFSLKVWREGGSSLPFILGQSAIAAVLLRKHFQFYSLTGKLFPSGFYAFMSAAMLCFYSYVLISGGNPPPKKSKLATTPS